MTRHRLLVLTISALTLSACATVPAAYVSAPLYTAAEPSWAAWGQRLRADAESHPGLSGTHVLQAGIDGLATRIQLIRRAKTSLDLQYFIFRGDAAGAFIAEELRLAADRGVRVRILVDDGDTAQGDERILRLDGYRGIHVRVFNPFSYRGHNLLLRNLEFVLHRARLDYRMHDKLMLADSAVALIGGRNIADEYFQIDPHAQYADDDVFAVGAAVPEMTRAFDQFWNSDMAIPAQGLKGSATTLQAAPQVSGEAAQRIASGEPLRALLTDPQQLTWSPATLLFDSPDKRLIERRQAAGRLMSGEVEKRMGETQHELVLVSPYFVPSEGEAKLLTEATRRAVQVRVLTNSLESTPEIAAHSGYLKTRRILLRAGAQMYEVRARLGSTRGSGQGRSISRYGNYALHGKMYVFDRRLTLLGSWNLDQRSLRINTEIGLLIDDASTAQEITRRFEQMANPEAAYHVILEQDDRLTWETQIDHQPVRLTHEPSRGWWPRLKAWTLSLLPLGPEL